MNCDQPLIAYAGTGTDYNTALKNVGVFACNNV